MNRSTTALILTTVSALIAHVSVYMPTVLVKYVVSGIGAIIAIVGAIILFTIRKPFVKIYVREDWYLFNEGEDRAEYHLRIRYKDFKKSSPNVLVEYGNGRYWSNFDLTIAVDDDTNDIILATKHYQGAEKGNFDNLDSVRVTIK